MLICSTQFSTKTILTHPPHYHSKPIVDLLPSTAQQIVSQNISWKSVKTPEYKVGPKTWYQCVVSNPSSLCIIAFWALVPDWPRDVSPELLSKAVSWGIWFVSHFFAPCANKKKHWHSRIARFSCENRTQKACCSGMSVCFLTSTKYKNVQQNFIPQATAYCTLPPSQDIGFINVKYYQPELVEEASGRISYCGNSGVWNKGTWFAYQR